MLILAWIALIVPCVLVVAFIVFTFVDDMEDVYCLLGWGLAIGLVCGAVWGWNYIQDHPRTKTPAVILENK